MQTQPLPTAGAGLSTAPSHNHDGRTPQLLHILDASGSSGPLLLASFSGQGLNVPGILLLLTPTPLSPGGLLLMQAGTGCSHLLPPADGALYIAMRPTFLFSLKSKWLCSLWALGILNSTEAAGGCSRKSPVSGVGCGAQSPQELTPGMRESWRCHLSSLLPQSWGPGTF